MADLTLLRTLAEKQSSVRNMSHESFVGAYGHPVEGDMEVDYSNGTLYYRFGTWLLGRLIEYPDFPNTFTVTWDTDFVQDIYFALGGELLDIFVQFENNDTLNMIFDDVYTFRRGVSLDTLPVIPWDPETCGPE